MFLTPLEIVELLVIGLVAGGLGGLLGIGGSTIMIPAMAIIFLARPWGGQHLYQGAAMLVNVLVAVPAARQHIKAGALRRDLFRAMLPATLLFIIVGVLVSDVLSAALLKRLFALFLIYVALDTAWKIFRRTAEVRPEEERVTRARGWTVGGAMGFVAGLLGVGGGAIAVPLAHLLCRLPLRNCIAASAAVMGITAGVGAFLKIALLPGHGHAIIEPFVLFFCLAPGAVFGAHIGAKLTHKLPLGALRTIFAVAMFIVAARMWIASGAPAPASPPAPTPAPSETSPQP